MPMNLTQVQFAKHIGVSFQRINELVNAKRGVTPETAWLLAEALGTEFWLNLQNAFDLANHMPDRHVRKLLTA